MAHALLGASSSSMWLNCPGSARANEKMPDSESAYALEGTVAHEMCEIMLRTTGKESHKQLKALKAKYPDIVNPEMNDHCHGYANYVNDIMGELLIEQKLDFSEWVPEGFGTGDAVKINDEVLHAIDFKYGKGIKVEAEDNTQLKLYALGAINALSMIYDFNRVVVHIYQPRLGEPTVAEYTVEELLEWAESIRIPAQKAWDGVEEYHSGSHCKWCKIKGTCKTRLEETAKAAFEDMVMEPEEVKDLVPNRMSEAEILYWLPLIDPITKFLKDLKSYAEDQAINHEHTFEGWKVVEGRSNRVYSDPKLVIQTLDKANVPKGYLTDPELLGITALEKHIGKTLFKDLVDPLLIKPPGKPTLVPLTDKREPLESAKATFND
jgi:hypothetical protein